MARQQQEMGVFAGMMALLFASTALAASCDPSTLNTTTYLYPITVENTTIADVAAATDRGLCDIARANYMADESIVPNVGQQIVIPPQICPSEVDNTSCVLTNQNSTNTCLIGGPRLYYTVNQDTYAKIANRLDLSVSAFSIPDGTGVDTILAAGQFVKVPLCSPSICSFTPWQFTAAEPKVYKDLAEEYDVTVGQIMMLSPTYNYSQFAFSGEAGGPVIDLPLNCSLLSSNITVIT